MHEDRIDTAGVPAKLYAPAGARGLLLLGHGGARSKDTEPFVSLSRRYAEDTGLAAVCIDAVDHGERRGATTDSAAQPPDATGPPPMWHSKVADQMVDDWVGTCQALSAIGPPVAYVGFSMGAIFGFPVVAAMPSIQAAVFVLGGIPGGGGIEDPPLGGLLLEAASRLEAPHVLMANASHDEIFPLEGVHALFDAIPGSNKRLVFWPGNHDWPPEAIDWSVAFLKARLG